MTNYSLAEVISSDLSAIANPFQENVSSEESIRLLLQLFNQDGLLRNARLVSIYKLDTYLGDLLKQLTVDEPAHYQFMVEFGRRDNKEQGNRGSAHYAALDLFIRPGRPALAFFADHARGLLDNDLRSLLTKLHIQIAFVSGVSTAGKKIHYQTDDYHCPIFTLAHLENSARDTDLLPFLETLPMDAEGIVRCSWYQLPPQYLLNAQSVSGTLFGYVEAVKGAQPVLRDDEADATLEAFKFDSKLSDALIVNNEIGKVQNSSIKNYAAKVAGRAVIQLEFGHISNAELIELCYRERYPLVCDLLHNASHFQSSDSPHPLFQMVFSQAHILEECLKNSRFNRIFNHAALLQLMQDGLIDPMRLFHRLTIIGKGLEPSDLAMDIVPRNLFFLEKILNQKDLLLQPLPEHALIDMLLLKSTANFMKNELLSALFIQGKIPCSLINNIEPSDWSDEHAWLLESDVATATEHLISKSIKSAVPVKVSDEDELSMGLFGDLEEEGYEEDDLFDVPAPVSSPSHATSKKPETDVHLLLAYSMFGRSEACSSVPVDQQSADEENDQSLVDVKGN